jgi:hypothetical protein
MNLKLEMSPVSARSFTIAKNQDFLKSALIDKDHPIVILNPFQVYFVKGEDTPYSVSTNSHFWVSKMPSDRVFQ